MSPRSAVGILVIAFFVFNIVMYNKAQKVRRALSRIEYKYYCIEYHIAAWVGTVGKRAHATR